MSVLGKLLGAAIDTAVLPFSLAKDVVTLGGVLSADGFGDGKSATVKRIQKIAEKIDAAAEEASGDK